MNPLPRARHTLSRDLRGQEGVSALISETRLRGARAGGLEPGPGAAHSPTRRLHAQTHTHSLARAHPPPRAHVRTRAGSSPPPAARGSTSPCSTQTCHPETQGDQGGGGTPTHRGPRPTSAPGMNPASWPCQPSFGLSVLLTCVSLAQSGARVAPFHPGHVSPRPSPFLHPIPPPPPPAGAGTSPCPQLPQHSATSELPQCSATTQFTAVHRPVPPSAKSRDSASPFHPPGWDFPPPTQAGNRLSQTCLGPHCAVDPGRGGRVSFPPANVN